MADEPIRSRPYSTAAACEKCVFGRGEHASFCSEAVIREFLDERMESALAEFYHQRPFSGAIVEAQSPVASERLSVVMVPRSMGMSLLPQPMWKWKAREVKS